MTDTVKAEDKSLNTGMAVVAYLIFFIPLLTDAKDDPYVKFHTKQGVVLFIAWVVTWIVGIIPLIGWLLGFLASIGLLVLMLIGIINALQGQKKELPVIGKYAGSIKI